MAKETKAQRDARWAAESLAKEAELAKTWTTRLFAALEKAEEFNIVVHVKSYGFDWYDADERRAETHCIYLEYKASSEDDLYDLERTVSWKEEERIAANREYMAKQAALAKLTKEEKVLLGLSD